VTERPASIRIDDLTAPIYSAEIAAAFELVAPIVATYDWTPDGILAQAARETGLDDFGDPLHVEPLGVLLPSLVNEAGMSTLGQLAIHGTLVGHAKQKLLVTDLVKRHPEILEIPIERPIVIAGQGRTGTTHLHNLMSSDTTLRTMPYWESIEPVPPLAEQGVDYGPVTADDPRYQRCAEALSQLNTVLPHFRRMHDMYPEHVHEEIALCVIAFGGVAPETMAPIPTFRDWYLASDQTPYYQFMKMMLQALTFQRGGHRWLLKSPQHVEQLGPLMAVFPDATVVCTHRDPVDVAASMATMLTYAARLHVEPDRLRGVGQYWIDRMALMFEAMARDRHLVPTDQSIDVRFEDFMADDIAMVRRIYGLADQPFTDATEVGMQTYMEGHPRGVHGSVTYHMEDDFGIEPADLRTRLAGYSAQFGV
jgi:Sulfotransferase family